MQRLLQGDLPVVVEDLDFPAGRFLLQGELAYPTAGRAVGTAVLAGPHPLLGGNLHNNVVRGLGDGLAAHGLATLRFNYRGVGRSQGPAVDVAQHLARFWETSHVPDELDLSEDVQGAVGFLRRVAGPDLPLALIGYSFGCALLPSVRVNPDPAVLILVAPTVSKHDYDSYLSVRHPKLVIASEDDFATDAAELRRWFSRLPAPKHLIHQRRDNHFFRGEEAWLVESVLDFLRQHWR
jgi:alpha/beta superfamily hydrolase